MPPTDTGASHGHTAPPPSGGSGPRRLYRDPDEGHIGGVCAGVGDYLGLDPNIVRIAAIVLAITGPGVPAYILAWIFLPDRDGSAMAPWPHRDNGPGRRRGDRMSSIIGISLFALAFSVLWGDWWRPAHGWFLPVGLIAVGGWLLLHQYDDDDEDAVPPPPPSGGTPPPLWLPTPPTAPTSVLPAPFPPAGGTESTSPTDPDTESSPMPPTTDLDDPTTTSLLTTSDDPTVPLDATTTAVLPGSMGWGPTPPGGGDGGGGGDGSDGWASGEPSRRDDRRHRRSRRRRGVVGPIVFGALLLWGGLAGLTGVGAKTGLAVGLCLIGGGFVVGAFVGGSRALILPALLVGAALVVVSTVDIPLGSGIGDRTWQVRSLRDLDDSYALGVGDATLDLRDVQIPAGRDVDIDVKVGIGHLTVYVPEGLAVDVSTDVGAGNSEVLGHEEEGTGLETSRRVDGSTDQGHLDLDLHLGLGQVEVHRADPSESSSSIDTSDAPSTTTPTTVGTSTTLAPATAVS